MQVRVAAFQVRGALDDFTDDAFGEPGAYADLLARIARGRRSVGGLFGRTIFALNS